MKKNDDHIIDLIPSYLDGLLDKELQGKVESHLALCDTCATELKQYRTMFHAFETEENNVPTDRLRTQFLQSLEEEKRQMAKSLPQEKKYGKVLQIIPFFKIAASIALLLGSFFLGKYLQKEESIKDIASVQAERLALKQTAMLALMENKSASKRIQGVHYSQAFAEPDEVVIKALIDRMFYDENANVRRSAVEALGKFTHSVLAKNALIDRLKEEKDAGTQIIIIQILVKIQEKKAIESLQYMLQQKDTQPFVKREIKSLLPHSI